MNRSDWRYVDDPTVAMDESGRVAVAWVDQSGKDVLFQLYGPDGKALLAEPVNVSRSPGIFSWLPRIALSPDDPARIYVLWQEIVFSGGTHGGEAFFARSTDGGRSFGEPLNLSRTPAGDGKGRLGPGYWHNGSLDLAVGADGDLYAAWTEYEGRLWLSRSRDGGRSFSEPYRVTAGGRGEPARGPSVVAGPGGRVHLAWAVGEEPRGDIRFTSSEDGGESFGEPRVVHDSDGHSDAPGIAVGGEGTVHLVYAESPDGRLVRYHVRYTRSRDHGATFDAPRAISRGHSESYESVSFPELALDEDGGVYVLWHLFPDYRERPRGLGLVVSGDGGDSFGPPGVVPGTVDPEGGFTGSLQGLLVRKLAVASDGRVAVVNSTFRPDDGSWIRLIRGRVEGLRASREGPRDRGMAACEPGEAP